MASDNIKLGQLDVRIPQAGDDKGVDVRFTYDVNGLLQVEATLVATREVHALVIEGNPGMLGEQEIAQRFAALSELKIHPRERIENRTLLARAERLYQHLRGMPREQLGREITCFETALESQDHRVIVPAARAFREVVDYFDHQSFLLPDA